MPEDPAGVVRVTGLLLALPIGLEDVGDGRRFGGRRLAVLAAGEHEGALAGLPVGQDLLAVGVAKVVGVGEAVGPIAAVAGIDLGHPATRPVVAAVEED